MKWYKEKICLKHILLLYVVLYAFFAIVFCSLTTQTPIGEFDEYTLVTASLLNDGNVTVTTDDISYAKVIFPEFAEKYETSTRLSGYIAKNGGELSFYAPTYSIACVPLVQLLVWMELPAIYGFAFTNVLCVCVLSVVVILCTKVNNLKKFLLTVFLTINPIIFYFTWQSAEVFLYATLGLAVFAWINKKYKTGGALVSIAGSLNPTIMAVGICMILDYFLELFFVKQDEKIKERFIRILKEWKNILLYAATFLFALIPFAYNFYISGNISLPASQGAGAYTVNVWEYFRVYLFDWNFGFLPYYSFFFILFLLLVPVAICVGNRRFILLSLSFFATVYAYSMMVHINCGMSGMSRYGAWSAVIVIFAVIYYFDELIKNKLLYRISIIFQILSVFICCIIIVLYGPMRASKTTHVSMTPLAKVILNEFPELYNPLGSTFNARINGIDGGYSYTTPIIYSDSNGFVRKILMAEKDIDTVLECLSGSEAAVEWAEKHIMEIKSEEYISIPRQYELEMFSTYELGEKIWFCTNEKNSDRYVKRGLSNDEGTHAWTDGDSLVLSFRLTNYEEYENFHACFDVLWVYNQEQKINVYVNGKEVVKTVSTGGNVEFDFQLSDSDKVEIKLEFPDAISPMEVSGAGDDRKLALALKNAYIEGKKAYETLSLQDQILFYTDEYNATNYVVEGLSWNEKSHSWTDGNQLVMRFMVDMKEKITSLRAKFELKWVYNKQQRVIIYANKNCVFDDIVLGSNIEFEFDAPMDGIVDICMELPDAVSPLELGQSQDARKLALALRTFQITPAD